jgi:putative membrane protein
MHMFGWDGFGWFGMLLMTLFWFGLIALLIWGVTRAVDSGRRSSPDHSSSEDRAIAILRERYARGEITEEEYHAARKTLDDHS